MRHRLVIVLACLSAGLSCASSGEAHVYPTKAAGLADRPAATRALAGTQRLLDASASGPAGGARLRQGIAGSRTLSARLRELAVRYPALRGPAQARASEVLARPQYDTPPHHACGPTAVSGYTLCFNWVDAGADAPDPGDYDGSGLADQIETVVQAYARAFNHNVADMGWRAPVCDAQPGESSCTVDVYVKNIDVPGYAALDPGQTGPAQRGFLVVDSDVDGQIGDNRTRVIRWTAAYDVNTLIQDAYDTNADAWMADSTSMWAEEQDFPDNDWWLGWMEDWARIPHVSLTSAAQPKTYGDVIWNHYLTSRFGPGVIRVAWEQSTASGSFAPGAYDRAIRRYRGGRGFAAEFVRFAATTTAWNEPQLGLPNAGDIPGSIHRAGSFTANFKRFGGRLDHAAYYAPAGLSDQEYETSFDLEARLPKGTAGGIALLGHSGPWRLNWRYLPRGGASSIRVSLGRVQNIYALTWTGVVINADVRKRGWNSVRGDWAWTRDRQRISGRFSTPRCRTAERNLARLRRSYRRARGGRRRAFAKRVHQAELLWSLRCGPSIF